MSRQVQATLDEGSQPVYYRNQETPTRPADHNIRGDVRLQSHTSRSDLPANVIERTDSFSRSLLAADIQSANDQASVKNATNHVRLDVIQLPEKLSEDFKVIFPHLVSERLPTFEENAKSGSAEDSSEESDESKIESESESKVTVTKPLAPFLALALFDFIPEKTDENGSKKL